MSVSFAPLALDRVLIGMVHVGALPGSPKSETSPELLATAAAQEAEALEDAGFDACIIENMHDRPYVHGDALGPEIIATMARVAIEVATVATIPFGVQILSGGNRHAMAVAHATGGEFIRAENFVFAHIADEGLLAEAEAGALLRYRSQISADIAVFADIKKKHASHAITGDISIGQAAETAAFFGADALVVTGSFTGDPASIDDVRAARAASGLPVVVGSGTTAVSVADTLEVASGVIVGSDIKRDGKWFNPIDPDRAAAFVRAARAG
ncbi:MAG: BtpA/SgcQ family protein [Planctomycetota bacterium]